MISNSIFFVVVDATIVLCLVQAKTPRPYSRAQQCRTKNKQKTRSSLLLHTGTSFSYDQSVDWRFSRRGWCFPPSPRIQINVITTRDIIHGQALHPGKPQTDSKRGFAACCVLFVWIRFLLTKMEGSKTIQNKHYKYFVYLLYPLYCTYPTDTTTSKTFWIEELVYAVR